MDSRDIFRRFFGFPNRHPSSFGDEEETRNNGQDDERFNLFFDNSSRGLEGMFEHFHGDMWLQMESLHKQMEDMFNGFGAVDFPSSSDQPNIRSLDPDGLGKHGQDDKVVIWSNLPNPFFRRSEKRSLRDFMLKDDADDGFHPRGPALPVHPFVDKKSKFDGVYQVPHRNVTGSQNKGDTDLDGKISEDKIVEMINKPKHGSPSGVQPLVKHQPKYGSLSGGQPLVEQQPKNFSARRSISVMTVKGADNKVEHQRTVKDSSGSEERTVTRSMGDKSYTVTTVTGKDGTQQKHETFNNMDESDVPKFDEEWAKKRQPPRSTQSSDSMLSDWRLPAIDDKDRNLYSKLFGWKHR